MSERLARGLNAVVGTVSRGRMGVEVNPEFQEWQEQVQNEETDLATRIYDRGTLVVIDGQNQRFISRFRLVRRE